MVGVGGETTQNDVVLEAMLQDFEGLMRSEAVANENAWFLVSSFFSLGIKDTL